MRTAASPGGSPAQASPGDVAGRLARAPSDAVLSAHPGRGGGAAGVTRAPSSQPRCVRAARRDPAQARTIR